MTIFGSGIWLYRFVMISLYFSVTGPTTSMTSACLGLPVLMTPNLLTSNLRRETRQDLEVAAVTASGAYVNDPGRFLS